MIIIATIVQLVLNVCVMVVVMYTQCKYTGIEHYIAAVIDKKDTIYEVLSHLIEFLGWSIIFMSDLLFLTQVYEWIAMIFLI